MSALQGADGDIVPKCAALHLVGGKYAFQEGEQFQNYEQLMERMDLHSKESMVYYWHRDSRTVENAHTKTSRPISAHLKYYSLRFACIYGGVRKPIRGSKQRAPKGNHKRTDCPAYVLMRASKCGQKLEVASVCNVHNHEISEQEAEKLPQTRRMSDDVKDEVIEMLKLKIDRKKIIEYVQLRDDKNITSKCLFNLAARIRSTELGPVEPEKRAQILQRIIQFSQEKGIRTIVSNELTNSESDESTYYQIGSNDLIEYISPEHEFGVNETIIGSIVEARQRDTKEVSFTALADSVDVHQNDCSTIVDAEDFIGRTTTVTEGDSSLILYDSAFSLKGVQDDIFISKEESNCETTNFLHHPDEVGEHLDTIKDDLDNVATAEDSESTIIVYEHEIDEFSGDGEAYSSHYTDSTSVNNCSVVLYETTTDVIIGESNEESTKPLDGADKAVERFKPTQKVESKTSKSYEIKRNINRSSRIVSRCGTCGTDLRLVRAQVDYLKTKRDKLLAETKLLRLKKKKLLHEIRRLE
ncbi:uncharacterized protein LOC119649288 isoform X1 [Hermetia illucens]|nr:uncharacterized protein LOC119649288 isoform X1 [Hermetia illucens]